MRAIADAVPVMRNTFAEGADGKPRLIVNDTVNMGLAVDVDEARRHAHRWSCPSSRAPTP